MEYADAVNNQALFTPYREMGKKFHVLAIIGLIFSIWGIVESIFVIYGIPLILQNNFNVNMLYFIDTIIDIVALVFLFLNFIPIAIRILIYTHAKNAAREFNQPALMKFSDYYISSIVLSLITMGIEFVSSIMIVWVTITRVFMPVQFVQFPLEVSLVNAIIGASSSGLLLVAWLSLINFFKMTTESTVQNRGIRWIRLIIISLVIGLGETFAIEIPSTVITIMVISNIRIYFPAVINVLIQILPFITSTICTILGTIGTFRLGTVFISLETTESTRETAPSMDINHAEPEPSPRQ